MQLKKLDAEAQAFEITQLRQHLRVRVRGEWLDAFSDEAVSA
jgi:hypothetical protein